MRSQHMIVHTLLNPTLSGLLLCMSAFNASAVELSQQQIQLRAHYTQLLSARKNLEQSLARGELKQIEIADYRAWIRQLDTRVVQTCQQLSIADKASLPADLPCKQLTRQGITPVNININTETTAAEKTALIVDQLSSSLGNFDEQLLQEQERVKAKTSLSEPSGDVSGGGTSEGSDIGAGVENANDGSDADDSRPPTSESIPNASTQGQNQSGENNTGPAPSGQPGSAQKVRNAPVNTTPEDIPDGRDDDVVARQIREAAEKEQDPALKEKLWDEYRRYKAGTS